MAAVLLTALAGAAAADEPEREQRTRQLVDEGLSRFNVGEYDEAAKRFTQAYVLQPLPELLYDLAQIAAKQGRREKAIELYRRFQVTLPPATPQERAIAAKVDDMEAVLKQETPAQQVSRRLQSGRALLAHGRLDDAEEELNAGYAIEQQPAFLVALGDVARTRNDRSTAIERYRHFLDRAPADDPARPYVHATLESLQPLPPAVRRSRRLWWIAAPVGVAIFAGIVIGINFGNPPSAGSLPTIPITLHQ